MSFNDLPVEVLTKIAWELDDTFNRICRKAREAGYSTRWQFDLPPDEPLKPWQLALIGKVRGKLFLWNFSGPHAAANLISALQLVRSAGQLDFMVPGDLLNDLYDLVVAARPRGLTRLFVTGDLTVRTARRPSGHFALFDLDCTGDLHVEGCDPCVREVTCDMLVSTGVNNLPNLRRLTLLPRSYASSPGYRGVQEPHDVSRLVAEVRGLTGLHVNLRRAMDLPCLLGHVTGLNRLALEALEYGSAAALSASVADVVPLLPDLRLGFTGALDSAVTLTVSTSVRRLVLSKQGPLPDVPPGALAIDRPERLRELVISGCIPVRTDTLARMFSLRKLRLDYFEEALLKQTADTLARVAVSLFRIRLKDRSIAPQRGPLWPGHCPGFILVRTEACFSTYVRHASTYW